MIHEASDDSLSSSNFKAVQPISYCNNSKREILRRLAAILWNLRDKLWWIAKKPGVLLRKCATLGPQGEISVIDQMPQPTSSLLYQLGHLAQLRSLRWKICYDIRREPETSWSNFGIYGEVMMTVALLRAGHWCWHDINGSSFGLR